MSLIPILALVGAVRVFSADYCADQLVLALADREQVAALSVDAQKDFSYLRALAKGLPRARAEAEQVYSSNADIVLRFWGGDEHRLQRFGAEVVTLNYAADFDAIRENVRAVANAIDQEARGEKLIAEMNVRLATLAGKGPSDVDALYVTPGGVTAGAGTIIDAIFSAAGVNNIAADAGLSYWPAYSAEALVSDPPEFIVSGFFAANSERINHWSAARHPALRRSIEQTPRIELSADLLACPNFFSVEAAEAIRKAVDDAKR